MMNSPIPAEEQEDLRRRVVEAVQEGLLQTEPARFFAVARDTVSRRVGLVERTGCRPLKARRRGRPPVWRLAPHQAATKVRYIAAGCPDQLSLPFALWTREAVQALLSRKFDLEVSVWTVGRYLRAWGLTPCPIRCQLKSVINVVLGVITNRMLGSPLMLRAHSPEQAPLH